MNEIWEWNRDRDKHKKSTDNVTHIAIFHRSFAKTGLNLNQFVNMSSLISRSTDFVIYTIHTFLFRMQNKQNHSDTWITSYIQPWSIPHSPPPFCYGQFILFANQNIQLVEKAFCLPLPLHNQGHWINSFIISTKKLKQSFIWNNVSKCYNSLRSTTFLKPYSLTRASHLISSTTTTKTKKHTHTHNDEYILLLAEIKMLIEQ